MFNAAKAIVEDANFITNAKFARHKIRTAENRRTDDEGNLKKLHLHWVGRCDPRKISSCANILGLKENEIEKGRDFKSLVQYLVHLNDEDKFQYSPDSVESNIPDIGKYFCKLSEGQIAKDLASAKARMSWYDLIQYAIENDCYDSLRRNLGVIKLCWEESTEKQYHDFCDRTLI